MQIEIEPCTLSTEELRAHTILVFLDIETTGLRIHDDVIIEIASSVYVYREAQNTFESIGSFQSLIKRDRDIDLHIYELTGIQEIELKHAPHIHEVQEAWSTWLESYTKHATRIFFVGHSIDVFDIPIIKREGFFLPESYQCIDTNIVSRILFPFIGACNLEYLSEYLSLPVDEYPHGRGSAHRALYDTFVNALLFIHCVEMLTHKGYDSAFIETLQAYVLHGFAQSRLSLTSSPTPLISHITTTCVQKEHIVPWGVSSIKDVKSLLVYIYTQNPIRSLEILHELAHMPLHSNYTSVRTNLLYALSWLCNADQCTDTQCGFYIPPTDQIILYELIYGYISFHGNSCGISLHDLYKNHVLYHCIESLPFEYDGIVCDIMALSQAVRHMHFIAPESGQYAEIDTALLHIQSFTACFQRLAQYGVVDTQDVQFLQSSPRTREYVSAFKHMMHSFSALVSYTMSAYETAPWYVQYFIKELHIFCDTISRYNMGEAVPFARVHGTSVQLYFMHKRHTIHTYIDSCKERNISWISFISPEKREQLYTLLAIPVDTHKLNTEYPSDEEIEQAHALMNVYTHINEVSTLVSEVQSLIDTQKLHVVVLNSYTLYSQVQSYVQTFAHSSDVFQASLFMSGKHGSITKGLHTCIMKKTSYPYVLVVKLRELPMVVNFFKKQKLDAQWYFFGNNPVQCARYWAYVSHTHAIRAIILDATISRALYAYSHR